MPLTGKDKDVLHSMERTYGNEDKAKRVFYASINAGKVKNIPEASRMAKRRGKRKSRRGRR